jgi:hypothetical protein
LPSRTACCSRQSIRTQSRTKVRITRRRRSPCGALDRRRIDRASEQILQRAADRPGDTQQIDQPVGMPAALLDSRDPLHRPADLLSKTGLRNPRCPSPRSDIAADHAQQARALITSHEPQPYKINCYPYSRFGALDPLPLTKCPLANQARTVARIRRQETAKTHSSVAEIHRQALPTFTGRAR